MKSLLPALATILLSSSAFAFENDLSLALTEDDYLTDIPIVLSASRLSQPESEASTTISVITRDMIDASTASNVPDLLRMVPGFQVGYFNGNTPVVTYHGLTEQYSRRIQVLIDGRSIYTPTFGGVLWSSLPITLDDIERIEVTRGPNASTYGSNSFFAVISIKTYNAYDTQGNYLRVIKGDNGRHQTLYRAGGQTDNADFRVTLAHRGDQGHDISEDSYDETLFKLRVDYTLDDNSSFIYQAGVNTKMYLRDAIDSAPVHDIFTDTNYHHIKWEKTLDESSSLSLQYYYNFYELEDMVLSYPFTGDDIEVSDGVTFNDALAPFTLDPFQVEIDESNTAERHDFELNYYFNPTPSVRTVSGLSQRKDIVQSARLFDTTDKFITDITRAFGHVEWRINNDTLLNTGLMIEDHEISDISYSPRISLIKKITPSQSIRFGISTATRAPSTIETSLNAVYYPSLTVSGTGICTLIPALTCLAGTDDIIPVPVGVTDGDVDFEKIVSTEIGYHGELLKNKLSMDLKIFYDEVSDLIVNEDNESFHNVQSATLKGLEYAAKYSPSDKYKFNFSYAYIEIEDEQPDSGTLDEVYEETAPENSFSLVAFAKLDNTYSASLEYFYVDSMFWADVSNKQEKFDILNLKLSKTIRFKKSTFKASLLLRNLSGDYNDYGEYSRMVETIMSQRIALDLELTGF